MHSLIEKLEGIWSGVVKPLSVQRMLEAYPGAMVTLHDRPPSINAESVSRWHELVEVGRPYKPGTLTGWKATGDGGYEAFRLARDEYSRMVRCEVTENWPCDVQAIHGFSSSKADLSAYVATDAMAEERAAFLIHDVSPEGLAKCLAHREIRIIHSAGGGGDFFARFNWDGPLWLMNGGGSHHLAGAKYVAARLRLPVPLNGMLRTYAFNLEAIASLRLEFEIFAIRDEARITNAFSDAMRDARATWLWHKLPRPYTNARAILLPKSEGNSMRVAHSLCDAGMLDLGAHWSALALRSLGR